MCVCRQKVYTQAKDPQSMSELVRYGNAQINHNVLKVSESSKC